MNIKLLSDRILVEVDETEAKTSSGVIVTKSSEPNDPKIGKVVAVGPGARIENAFVPTEVKVGDEIMFHYGTKVMVEGKSYTLLHERNEVLMIL